MDPNDYEPTTPQSYISDGERQTWERTLRSREERLGVDHPHTIAATQRLAELCFESEDYRAAERLHRRSLGFLEQSTFDDPNTLDCRLRLAVSLRLQGKSEEATVLCRSVLDVRRHLLGPIDCETVEAAYCLARSFRSLGDFAAGEEVLRSLLRDQVEHLGLDHLETLWTRHLLGRLLAEAGHWSAAKTEIMVASQGRSHLLGASHQLSQVSLDLLAYIEHQLRRA